ncbi:TIGR04013 family B12-binding domain/radical SAM domain-containing protein [Methanoplanus endosymbiosus]|uniref:TIGR04013 family B12-binding domain/radical SAM domain-containing protein n=1 Tax=Methanoplanus endosymbiosus TaxID=33865 RepID=A0A9E7TI41_9EURY|nr:TIGR04013 family B12-binding domain/radical SAM domain-containing protein [Methanoplanus endosymbiosus]UUX91843.1 TIGR04013 family B12-binding domain/radical SAM domain-containing protein [Methanoplanus endosymbiosus]
MKINWRNIKWAGNSYAALYAACELAGYDLIPVEKPEDDITLYSLNSVNADHFSGEIRDADCITIIGGPHPSADYKKFTGIADYVVVGEAEYSLPALLKYLDPDSPAKTLPAGVAAGDSYREKDYCVIPDAYPPFTKIKGYVEISRGCPYGCAYCQTPRLFGQSIRHRSIGCIVKAASGYRDVRFISPNSLAYGSKTGTSPDYEKLEKLLSSFRKDQNVYLGTFPSEVRPEFVTEKSLELISDYCSNKKIHFGAQSGSNRMLKKIRRGHTAEDVISAVELCREFGFTPVVDYIIGLPGEEKEDQVLTLEQIKWVCRYGKVHSHYFTPLAGTPFEYKNPAPLIPDVNKTLGKLSLNGKVTGYWSESGSRFFNQEK